MEYWIIISSLFVIVILGMLVDTAIEQVKWTKKRMKDYQERSYKSRGKW
tara:strand:+ start:1162 stop:1308 length:147 start_codon:yes stop_codon:yes gene_type:complete